MRNVKVQLRSGFLARYVDLHIVKQARGRWVIEARDANGTATRDITVDDIQLAEFTTQGAAIDFMNTLPEGHFWATSDRKPSSYIAPADNGSGYELRVA